MYLIRTFIVWGDDKKSKTCYNLMEKTTIEFINIVCCVGCVEIQIEI